MKIKRIFITLSIILCIMLMGCEEKNEDKPEYLFLDCTASLMDSDIETVHFLIDYAFLKKKIDVESIVAITETGEELNVQYSEWTSDEKLENGYFCSRINCRFETEALDRTTDTVINKVKIYSGDKEWELKTQDRIKYVRSDGLKVKKMIFTGMFSVNLKNDISQFWVKQMFTPTDDVCVEGFGISELYNLSEMKISINDVEVQKIAFPINLKKDDHLRISFRGDLVPEYEKGDVYINSTVYYEINGVPYKAPFALMITNLSENARWEEQINNLLEKEMKEI